MKDFFGKELEVDDYVLGIHQEYVCMLFGKIIELNEYNVTIKYNYNNKVEISEFFLSDLVKIDKNDAVVYKLKNKI